MKKITLSAALKRKKRLAAEIKVIKDKIIANNSVIVGNPFVYDLTMLTQNLSNKKAELTDLKIKIRKANIGIAENMVEIEEAKDYLNFYKMVKERIKEGVVPVKFGDAQPQEYRSQIGTRDIDKNIEETKEFIYNKQDEIDKYNASTFIEI